VSGQTGLYLIFLVILISSDLLDVQAVISLPFHLYRPIHPVLTMMIPTVKEVMHLLLSFLRAVNAYGVLSLVVLIMNRSLRLSMEMTMYLLLVEPMGQVLMWNSITMHITTTHIKQEQTRVISVTVSKAAPRWLWLLVP